MKRLQSELAAPDTTAFTRMAGKWMELAEIVGEKNMPKLFAAWDKARIDIRNPSPAILAGLLQTSHDPRIVDWWKTAQSPMIRTPSVSDFTPSQPTRPAAANKKAAGKKTELAIDDGEPKGKLSLARSGHAVGFEAPADGCNLILVKIFGSRYGTPYPPAEDFHVYLCDADGKQIKDFSFPYKNFLYGSEHWVTLKLPKPAEVPKNFILCIDFNPTKTKGVYVCHDAQCDGDSRTGLPGELDNTFENGDWMIRAVITGPPPNVKRVRNDRPRDNLGK